MKDPIEQQMDIEESRNLTRNPAEAGFAGAPGSAFRLLSQGEIIQENDEFLDDSGTWRKTICAGASAPNPVFTSHRQYRRRWSAERTIEMKTNSGTENGAAVAGAATGSPFFVFDVESVGLHGEGFAVAGGVYLANGDAQWEFRLACPIDECAGDDEDRKWVKENVPVLEETHRSPKAMRDEFWRQWMRAKAGGAVMAAECQWPVEAGFVKACIADDPQARKWEGPYPLHEIASYLAAAGLDPMAKYPRTPSEMPMHDPLADARQSARLLSEALARMANNRKSNQRRTT